MMKRLAITPGEPAGIGPELLVRYAQQTLPPVEVVAVASAALLKDTAQRLGLPLEVKSFSPEKAQQSGSGTVSVVDVELGASVLPGILNPKNSAYVLETLRLAAQMCMNRDVNAVVTGPVHKGVINEAKIPFTGHTEYFAEQSHTEQVVMMLACEGLRVALLTTHLPLKDVSSAINAESLSRCIGILHNDLATKFGLTEPNILICGLNPHAGEGGYLGHEEIDTINPVINQLRNEHGWHLSDAMPADTVFTPPHLAKADAVLAMYHDQGLPVLKHKGFGSAVNVTLGLPFIRTSVDHGTALDLAAQSTGKEANLGSLEAAVSMALTMANSHHGMN